MIKYSRNCICTATTVSVTSLLFWKTSTITKVNQAVPKMMRLFYLLSFIPKF